MYEETKRAVAERLEVEELLQKIPNLIAAAGGRLALGKTSEEEAGLLSDTKARFTKAFEQYKSIEPTDPKVLIETLKSCMKDLDEAGRLHGELNRGAGHGHEMPREDVGATVQ